jgi:hypothetical protein
MHFTLLCFVLGTPPLPVRSLRRWSGAGNGTALAARQRGVRLELSLCRAASNTRVCVGVCVCVCVCVFVSVYIMHGDPSRAVQREPNLSANESVALFGHGSRFHLLRRCAPRPVRVMHAPYAALFLFW